MKKFRSAYHVSLGVVHTHTHTHTGIYLVNNGAKEEVESN